MIQLGIKELAICQNCGKEVCGEQVIAIRYGKLRFTAHPHISVDKDYEEHFCLNCVDNVAIRRRDNEKENKCSEHDIEKVSIPNIRGDSLYVLC